MDSENTGQVKLVGLGRGYHTIIDAEDYRRVSEFSWSAQNCPTNSSYYAQAMINKSTVKMHRFIMNCPKGKQVDHIDGDTLNNRKSNLRIVSSAENSRNRRHQKSAKFKYKGIQFHARCTNNPWGARITINGKTISLGLYSTIDQAALAYNAAAVKYHGEFAKLNEIKE